MTVLNGPGCKPLDWFMNISKMFCILGLTARNHDLIGPARAHDVWLDC